MMIPELITIGVALVTCLAELLHSRRIRRLSRLAFGPAWRPSGWTFAAPLVRIVSISLAAWGFASLWLVVQERVHDTGEIADNEYKHLVLVVDVSPSMHLEDAGPDGSRTRRQRVSDIVESVFNRIPMRQFKITFIAVYSDAKPLLEDSLDHEVVRHIIETMPMWHAFKPGKTKLLDGITLAAKIAKPWNPDSAYVMLLTDGDSVPATGMPPMPASVAEFVVVGVGDPNSGKFIHDHQSRQDANSLRQIANRLRGVYHNGNQKNLTSQLVAKFSQVNGNEAVEKWSRREWSLAAVVVGSTLFAILPVLLHYFGSRYLGGTVIAKFSRVAA